jgi:hypothetical protein
VVANLLQRQSTRRKSALWDYDPPSKGLSGLKDGPWDRESKTDRSLLMGLKEGPVFPTAIAPEFAAEKPAKARMDTCPAQYKANSAVNANGGLKWIQKGGGYWAECDKRLSSE